MNSNNYYFKKIPPTQFEEYDPSNPAIHAPQELELLQINCENPVYYQQAIDSSVTADIESTLWSMHELPDVSTHRSSSALSCKKDCFC